MSAISACLCGPFFSSLTAAGHRMLDRVNIGSV